MKRTNPKNPRAALPRTQAQRKKMLDSAAARRREESLRQEVLHQRSRAARHEGRAERLEADMARARIAGINALPTTNTYIDHMITRMVEHLAREAAISMARDPEMDEYLRVSLMQAAQMIATQHRRFLTIRPEAWGGMVAELREEACYDGITLRITLPGLTVTNVVDPMCVNLVR